MMTESDVQLVIWNSSAIIGKWLGIEASDFLELEDLYREIRARDAEVAENLESFHRSLKEWWTLTNQMGQGHCLITDVGLPTSIESRSIFKSCLHFPPRILN